MALNNKKKAVNDQKKIAAQNEINDLITKANEVQVLDAYQKLGPIEKYTDLLVQRKDDYCLLLAGKHITHMLECWRYFSTAMYAYLNNEMQHAIHYAYYAELRAVLSLYAGSGINVNINREDGIFPYWINRNGEKINVGSNIKTHDFAWTAWREWIKRGDAQNLLLNSIFLYPMISLKELVSKLPQEPHNKALKRWGYDLFYLKDDHKARNIASYQAYWMDKPLKRMECSQVEFAKGLARLFIRAEKGFLFDKIFIQYLVQKSLQTTQISTKNKCFNRFVQEIAKNSGINEKTLKDCLNFQDPIAFTIFDKANEEKCDIENILARAAFLARIALLSVSNNYIKSENHSIKKWIKNWLDRCGGLGQDNEIHLEELEDLETDYREAVDEFFLENFKNLPFDLWSGEELRKTIKIVNPHVCIAWGLTS